MEELYDHIEGIKRLCGACHVKSLYAFGSVVSDKLKSDSDIDLVVDIYDNDPLAYSGNYFTLKFQLEHLFKRRVDLLENKAIKNPFLKKQVNDTKVLIYGR